MSEMKVKSNSSTPGIRADAGSPGQSRTAGMTTRTPNNLTPGPTTTRKSRPAGSPDHLAGMAEESAVDPAPMGLRLAPDVRLRVWRCRCGGRRRGETLLDWRSACRQRQKGRPFRPVAQ